MTRSATPSRAQLATACASESAVRRFWALTHYDASNPCLWFIGAISNRGHGRFWLGQGRVIIAHRFAWALAYGPAALDDAPVLAHHCDNPLCVNVTHLEAATPARNSRDWSERRTHWAGPLADPRGSRQRARVLRDGLRRGRPLAELLDEGRTDLERGQLALW